MIVAIDGPAGTGKSTVCARVAGKTGFAYLNTGEFYRAFAAKMNAIGDVRDGTAAARVAAETSIGYANGSIVLDGTPVMVDLHTPEIDDCVSFYSAVPAVRVLVDRSIRESAGVQDAIVEGRDMTTTVFPNAEVKLFLDAGLSVRANRRYRQLSVQQRGLTTPAEIEAKIAERDAADRNRPIGALRLGSDVTYIDTSDLTIAGVCERIIESIKRQSNQRELSVNMAEKAANGSSENSQTLQEELQEEYLKSLDELEVGQLLEGTIIQVQSEQVFVDVGYKSEGKIPVDEFEVPPKVGDVVHVVLLKKEGQHGEVVVSKRKADEKLFWRNAKIAFQDHNAIEGAVTKVVKGGFEVDLGGGLRGFNPISKMDLFRIEQPETYLDLKTSFYIERLYSEGRVNIILSRRSWLEEEVERKRADFFAKTQESDVVKGVVKSFTSFGAFIDLGGFDGLLHINDMSWGHVTRPKDYVKRGDEIELRVVKLDHENKKINLSLKNMTDNPWNSFTDFFQLDDVVRGKVTKLTEFGAFIELREGIEGLAHISELSWVKRIRHPKEILNVGDEVEAKILGYDLDAQKVSLGLKQVLPNPWNQIANTYPVGMRLTRPVKKITVTGAFVELEEGIDAFLHVDDISWTKKPKSPSEVLTEGEEIECIVTEIDQETHNIRVGIKQLSEDPWTSLRRAFPERSIIDGEITNITDFGVFVRVQGGIEGLINKSNLSDTRVERFEDAVKKINVGDKVRAVVVELNPSRQKLSLSLRELDRKEQQAEISKYIHDDTNESTFTIGDFLREDNDD